MTQCFKSFSIVIAFLTLVLSLNSCLYVGALAMSIETRKTTDNWRSGNYKTRIQRHAAWAGPYTYSCRVKEKKPGGLFYHTIVNEPFSNGYYVNHTIKYLVHKGDTIVVDLHKNNTFLVKSLSNH